MRLADSNDEDQLQEPTMKEQTMKKMTFTGVILLTVTLLLSLSNDLQAQQENTRRSLRGSPLFTPPPSESPATPGSTGAADPLGEDPGRANSGRPGLFEEGFVVEGIGGEGEMEEEPFMEEEIEGEGEMEEDPFMEEEVGPGPNAPNLLCQSWTHSREEEQEGSTEQVFRPTNYPKGFPPSRFRMRYVFHEDGGLEWLHLDPADAHRMMPGSWQKDNDVIHIFRRNQGGKSSYRILELNGDLLRIELMQ